MNPGDLPVEMLEGIMTTRAIRSFSNDPVTEEEILACLAAAQQAPSGGNSQPWQYVVVTDAGLRGRIATVYRTAYRRWERAQMASMPRFRSDSERDGFMRGMRAAGVLAGNLESAPVHVFFLMPRLSLAPADEDGTVDIGPLYASVYPAVQNLMLAARALGIGSVLTTVWWSRQHELRELLAIPDRFEIVALVPMGRPRGGFGVAPRRPVEVVTHWERFGERRPVPEP